MLKLPHKLGRYTLLLPIGSGGMGSVFLARMSGIGGFGRDVAVKYLHAHLQSDDAFVQAFLREARLAARIRHPNVVPVVDVDRTEDGVFLVMEYVVGGSLADLRKAAAARRQVLPPVIGIKALLDALAGLQAAHEAVDEQGQPLRLVHRDFSPQNILVGTDGVARLVDFGVAKVARTSFQTESGVIKGKLPYMSPEQARGGAVDARTDVWAAGVVAWELLAGRRLYKGGGETAVLLSIINDEPPSLATVRPDLSAEVVAAVMSALVRDPDRRCPDARSFAERLRGAVFVSAHVPTDAEVGGCVQTLMAESLATLRERTERAQGERVLRPSDDTPALARTLTMAGAEAHGSAATQPPTLTPAQSHEDLSAALGPAPRRLSRAVVLGVAGVVVASVLAFWLISSVGLTGRAPIPADTEVTPPIAPSHEGESVIEREKSAADVGNAEPLPGKGELAGSPRVRHGAAPSRQPGWRPPARMESTGRRRVPAGVAVPRSEPPAPSPTRPSLSDNPY